MMKSFLWLFSIPFFLFCTEEVQHECGIALVRLRKPISYYIEKHNDPTWGIRKLLLLMEKQRNRGQDGAGVAVMKFDMPQKQEYLAHYRQAKENALDYLVEDVMKDIQHIHLTPGQRIDEIALKQTSSFVGEALLGHLRYATYSGLSLDCCQPFLRSHYIPSCQFALAGNFNMTNTNDLLARLNELGISLTNGSDTLVILNAIAYQLDQAFLRSEHDIAKVLQEATIGWDGGYVLCGIIGNGTLFACRDPAGIRPGYALINEEVIAIASERAALVEAFDVPFADLVPIAPGHVLTVTKEGAISETPFTSILPERACAFERIYFSKANDPDIYQERKALGRELAPKILDALGGSLDHTIFSYVPNSSISAFQGVIEGVAHLSGKCPRVEYIIAKNQKIRTFISSEQIRKSLVRQLYEVTQGIIGPEDTIVVIDDSIIRGTTLQESLLPKLIQLNPKKIIIVSSAPPVLYPDCYGIDMSQLDRFIAFKAALSLLKETGQTHLLHETMQACIEGIESNPIQKIYAPFSLEELSCKIGELVTPPHTQWKGELQILYQSADGLKKALPNFSGDWYFHGDYPTPGGFQVVKKSFMNWYQGTDTRSY